MCKVFCCMVMIVFACLAKHFANTEGLDTVRVTVLCKQCVLKRCIAICYFYVPTVHIVVKWRRMRWAGHVARMGEGRGVHRVLVGKPEGKRPLG